MLIRRCAGSLDALCRMSPELYRASGTQCGNGTNENLVFGRAKVRVQRSPAIPDLHHRSLAVSPPDVERIPLASGIRTYRPPQCLERLLDLGLLGASDPHAHVELDHLTGGIPAVARGEHVPSAARGVPSCRQVESGDELVTGKAVTAEENGRE